MPAPPAAAFARAMEASVLLPIPGAPPSSTSDPGTSPPPKTRSSSPIPVSSRALRSALTARSGVGFAAGRAAREDPPPRTGFATLASSVFQPPQPGHWPVHASAVLPHSEQAYPGEERAMRRL